MDGLQGNIPLTWTILGAPPFMETPTSDTVETIGFFGGQQKNRGSKKIGVTDAPSPGPEAPAGAQLLELHELPWPAGGDEITWGFNVVKPKAVNHPIPSGTFSLGWPFNAIQLYLRI